MTKLLDLLEMKILSILHPKKCWNKPIRLQIETTNYCNLNCKMCLRNFFKIKRFGFLSYDNFLKIAKQFPRVRHIELYGLGESFLHKDIFKMISYFKNKDVKITTNGLPINKNMAEKIVNSNLTQINFSVDANEELYKQSRRSVLFNKLKENISYLVNLRNNNNSKLIISISIVALETNKQYLKDFVNLASELNVDHATIQEVNSLWYGKSVNVEKEVSETLKYSKENNVKLNYVRNPVKGKKICPEPFFGTYITWEGYVTPCCMLPSSDQINFGNVLEKSFKKIWNNLKYQKFRRKISRGVPEVCRGCPLIRRE